MKEKETHGVHHQHLGSSLSFSYGRANVDDDSFKKRKVNPVPVTLFGPSRPSQKECEPKGQTFLF